MSRSMPLPWIKPTALELIADVHVETGIGYSNCKPKLVQVIRGNETLGTLVVHDKEHFITAFLTQACLEEFKRSQPHRSIVGLKGSLVKLDRWHISTVVQCAAHKPPALGNSTITFPLCAQVSKLTVIGADDCNIFGDPKDINREPQILERLRSLNYLTLAERLSERQFKASHLPDVEGQFSIPHLYSKDYQLRWHHAVVPPDEQQVLDEITDFEQIEQLIEDSLREYRSQTTAQPRSTARKAPSSAVSSRSLNRKQQAEEDTQLPATQLEFTQTEFDEEVQEEEESETYIQSQRVMSFMTQDPFSQPTNASQSQAIEAGSVSRSNRRKSRNRRSSVGLAATQPLSPTTVEMFAHAQDGPDWYTQPLTTELLSNLEELWCSQDVIRSHTSLFSARNNERTPSDTRQTPVRPSTSTRNPTTTTATTPARSPLLPVSQGVRVQSATEFSQTAIGRRSTPKKTPAKSDITSPPSQPTQSKSTSKRTQTTRIRATATSSMPNNNKRNKAQPKRKRLNFLADSDVADSESSRENHVATTRQHTRRRLSSSILKSPPTAPPPLYDLVQNALDRLLDDTRPLLFGRDAFGNLIMQDTRYR